MLWDESYEEQLQTWIAICTGSKWSVIREVNRYHLIPYGRALTLEITKCWFIDTRFWRVWSVIVMRQFSFIKINLRIFYLICLLYEEDEKRWDYSVGWATTKKKRNAQFQTFKRPSNNNLKTLTADRRTESLKN